MPKKVFTLFCQVFWEGGFIKKSVIVVFLLLMLFYGLEVGNVVALERTFEVTSCGSRYEVYVEAPDTWQIGTQLEVKTRLTLIQKRVGGSQVEYVTNASRAHSESLNVGVSEGFAVYYFGDRGNQPENPFSASKDYWAFVNLTQDGDYWETQILLEMNEYNEGKLERGEIIDTVLVVSFKLDAFGVNHTKLDESFIVGTLSLPDDDQILVTVFRPSFSATEIYTAVGGCGIIVLGFIMFVMDRVGWVSFGFLNAFSKFADKYPLLTHIVSSIILVALWFFFIPALSNLFIIFSEFFILAFLFGGAFVISSIFLTVGLLEFILKDWKFLQIGLGFLLAILFTYILYFALDYLISAP